MNSMTKQCRIVRSLPRPPPLRRIYALSLRLLLVAVLLAILPSSIRSDSTGIPGTTQTLNGYDTEMGEDAMCWSSLASPTQQGGIPFPNGVLVANFSLADQVDLLRSCPNGTHLHGQSPPEFADPTFRPRTGEWYNYTVYGRLDLTALNGVYVASDTGSKISVSVVACDSVLAGFCSPFVHDQANLRVGQEMAQLRAEAEAQAAAQGQTMAPEPPTPAKKIPGKSHGGTHVHSPAILVEIPPEANVAYEFSIDVPMIVLEPSHFFVIVTLQFFTGDSPVTPKYRYDVSNALSASERYVSYQDPAMILEVTREVRLFAFVCVGITSVVLLGLIFQTFRHYNHQVMRLSQGPFLLLFLLAALCATVSSILLEPKNSLWCNLSKPLIVIPLQLLYAITLGRLWRIHAVVSPLLRNRLEHRNNDTRDHNWLQRVWHKAKTSVQPRQKKAAVLRREVSASTMAWLVLACTAPQVVLLALSWVLQPQDKDIEYNDDQSIGRSICMSDATASRSLVRYSMYVLLLLVMTLLGMAHVSRKLPSLLNESAVIYETTLVSVLMMIVSMGIQSITDNPTTSPDVAYIINIVLVLSITLNATLRIMIPKLHLIWTGQQVLVSQLVSDHKQRLRQSEDFKGGSSQMYNVSGLIMGPSSASQLHHDDEDEDLLAGASGNLRGSSRHLTVSSTISDHATPPSPSSTTKHDDDDGDKGDLEEGGLKQQDTSNSVSSQEVWLNAVEKDGSQRLDDDNEMMMIIQQEHQTLPALSQAPPKTSSRVCFADGEMKKVTSKGAAAAAAKRKVIIRQGQAPSKQLVIRMVDLHHELDRVNNRVMSGMNVEPDDWNLVRELTTRLEGMFANVEFEWERKQLLDNLAEGAVTTDPKREPYAKGSKG
jgi:7 transmembrane sweet-taste receptor of 3 GCPR